MPPVTATGVPEGETSTPSNHWNECPDVVGVPAISTLANNSPFGVPSVQLVAGTSETVITGLVVASNTSAVTGTEIQFNEFLSKMTVYLPASSSYRISPSALVVVNTGSLLISSPSNQVKV